MRRVAVVFSLLLLAVAGPHAHAEGVESRIPLGSTGTRIRGATTLRPVPWGFVSLGGSTLRQIQTGKTQWETLHKVPGDNLYRVAAHESGRLLASWENEDVFHLFVPKTKEHRTFPKPAKPSAEFRSSFGVDDLHFSEDGTEAIVFMDGPTGNSERTAVAYRYPLDGASEPTLLFRQAGYQVHGTRRVSVFVLPKDTRNTCDNNGCSIGSIVAWEVSGATASRTTLLSADGRDMTSARMVWGSDDDRVVMVVSERPNRRHLLRWRAGQAEAEYGPAPKGPGSSPETAWLTRSDELVEVWQTDGGGLDVKRLTPRGWVKTTPLPPLPPGDPDVSHDTRIHDLVERKNGNLVLHWGDHLVLLDAGKPPRKLYIEPMLKRRNEWAGVDVYAADPEALWIGIEVGGGRDFVQVPFADIEARATPWAK